MRVANQRGKRLRWARAAQKVRRGSWPRIGRTGRVHTISHEMNETTAAVREQPGEPEALDEDIAGVAPDGDRNQTGEAEDRQTLSAPLGGNRIGAVGEHRGEQGELQGPLDQEQTPTDTGPTRWWWR